VPEQAAPRIQHSFAWANLTALPGKCAAARAERVDEQMRAYMETRAIPGPGRPPEAARVRPVPAPWVSACVRAARAGDELNAGVVAVYVRPGGRRAVASRPRPGRTHSPVGRDRVQERHSAVPMLLDGDRSMRASTTSRDHRGKFPSSEMA